MTDTVPHAVTDVDSDGECEPDALTVPLIENVAEEQKDTEPVPHGDAVCETDMVPHALVDGDIVKFVDADGAIDPPLEPVPDELNELDCVVEIVGETVGVTDPDCDPETVPHGDAV